MEAKIKCDICGGELLVEEGGQEAACKDCGIKYSIARLREKIQNINDAAPKTEVFNTQINNHNEDVDQWLSLSHKYMSVCDYDNASKIISKILEVVPSVQETWNMYYQLENAKHCEIKDGVLKKYNGHDIKVTIPDGVTSIGDGAFLACSELTRITIPNSVTSIGNSAFWNCSGLTSITIPDSVTTIGSHIFCGCSGLTSITIPDSVTTIGSHMFYGCSRLTSITIPDSVTTIGSHMFYGCSRLTSITIPDSVTSIGEDAFNGCSGLTSITIPDSVRSIGDNAFCWCTGLTSITYSGTMAQWKAVTKGSFWYDHIKVTKVFCSDGAVAVN